MKGGETNKDRDTDQSHDGSRDLIDDLQVDHRSTSVLPVVNMIKKHERRGGRSVEERIRISTSYRIDEELCMGINELRESRMRLPVVMKVRNCTPNMWINTWRY